MTPTTTTAPRLARAPSTIQVLGAFAERAVRTRLERIEHGELTIVAGPHSARYGHRTERCALAVTLHVHDARFWTDIAFGGSIGAGEAYMEGYWHASDLTALVRILIANREVLDGVERGLARLAAPARKLLHWANRNTLRGSRRNIQAHYDLGNEFFALFLDETMMYSCAIFERPDMTLEDAQHARLERICAKLALRPTDHLLEIGTGWGGMAIHAARRYGCRVTTTTISREQHAAATERVRAAGVEDRVTVLLDDYRELTGRYEKLVSLEMIEAVGHAWYDTWFRRCAQLLAPDGLMLLQAITIADQRYEGAKRSVDFIQRYVFPGSCIPSVSALCTSMARASDLRLVHMEDIGAHYATTLGLWRARFLGRLDEVRALGLPERFIRMWEFYLCYCEGGFEERVIGDAQMLFAKPLWRG
jgi:cyclopropane-fatty-acyl-phospholipid synthase